LRGSLVAGAGVVAARYARGAYPIGVDPDLWVWLNDVHVSENTLRAPHGQNISGNLKHVVDYLLGLPVRPAGVFINGDCAHNKGLEGDYRQLGSLLKPLVEAEIPVHLTMGNHDHRETFFQVMGEFKFEEGTAITRQVAVVEGRNANYFLLDSLKVTNEVEGNLGEEQFEWLEAALDAHTDKPAIVMVHHNPQFEPDGPEKKFRWSGLEESDRLFAILEGQKHVVAYVHGHRHRWELSKVGSVHVINTPATGYVGDATKSSTGWTMARLDAKGVQITRYCIDPADARHGGEFALEWRNG